MKRSNRGSSTVLFALALAAIIASGALVIDIGNVSWEKARLSATMDSAALAGAQELITDPTNTETVVLNYIANNGITMDTSDVDIDTSSKTVRVHGSITVHNLLAGVFGIDSEDVYAEAEAKVENIRTITGARPLAVVQQTFEYGRMYTLKEGGGDGTCGNYAAISLGGNGAAIYRDNLLYGYSGSISVGDIIVTETGNIAGTTQTSINQLISSCSHTPQCTYLSYNRNCSRIIFIPVVNTLNVNGKKCVKVLGFATFFLEGVTLHSGQADVIGRFITYSMQGQTSSLINDYGTYGIRLIK